MVLVCWTPEPCVHRLCMCTGLPCRPTCVTVCLCLFVGVYVCNCVCLYV